MSNIIKSLQTSLAVKSLKDLVRVRDSEAVFLVVDCSGSMNTQMMLPDGSFSRRIDQLRRVHSSIQSQKQVPTIAFGFLNETQYYQEGAPPVYHGFVEEIPEPAGGTPLAGAIRFAREQGAGRLVVISDGEPNWPHEESIHAAEEFGGRIDVVYVGDPGSMGSHFMVRLAETTGGTQFEGDLSEPLALTGDVIKLLTGEVMEVDDDEEDEDESDDEDEDEEED